MALNLSASLMRNYELLWRVREFSIQIHLHLQSGLCGAHLVNALKQHLPLLWEGPQMSRNQSLPDIYQSRDMSVSFNGTFSAQLFLVPQPQVPFNLPQNKMLSSWAVVTKRLQASSTPAFHTSSW